MKNKADNLNEKSKKDNGNLVLFSFLLTIGISVLVLISVGGTAYEIRTPFSFMPNSHNWIPALDNDGVPAWVMTLIFTLPPLVFGLVAVKCRKYFVGMFLLAQVPICAFAWTVAFFTLSTAKMDIYSLDGLTDRTLQQAEDFYKELGFYPAWETNFNGRKYIFYQWERVKGSSEAMIPSEPDGEEPSL